MYTIMFTKNIKKLFVLLIIIILAMIFSLTYSISSNAEIRNGIENSINSNLDALSQSIIDIRESEQTPNTSYAKENSIALLSNISQYQVLNKKVNCFEFERLINGYRHLLYTIDEKGLNEESSKENDAILFESLEWNIKSVKEENDIATIEIEVTNKDYETAFKNYIQTMFQKFINNEDVTEEEQFTLLLNELKSDSLGNKTVTETINLTKTDGAWKINADENLAKALYPGLEDGIDSISSFMSLND